MEEPEPRKRIPVRFGIRSALAIVAVYAALFGCLRIFGWFGILAAFVSGTAAAGAILLAGRDDLRGMSIVAVGTLVGAFLGGIFLGDFILTTYYHYDHGFGEGQRSFAIGALLGAIVGGVGSSMFTFKQPPKDHSTNDPEDS